MLKDSIILGLLQFVGLSLPAIAIYLQVLHRSHTRNSSMSERVIDETSYYTDSHLAKASAAWIAISGLLLISDISVRQFQPILPDYVVYQLIPWIEIITMLFIGLGLVSFVLSILIIEPIPGESGIIKAYKITLLSILPGKRGESEEE